MSLVKLAFVILEKIEILLFQVSGNLWAVHNDEKIFENPEEFNPDRFINKDGVFNHSNHVVPFSIGPRHCLGEHLARMEYFILLVSLIRKFDFTPDPEADPLDLDNAASGFIFVAKAYTLIANPL